MTETDFGPQDQNFQINPEVGEVTRPRGYWLKHYDSESFERSFRRWNDTEEEELRLSKYEVRRVVPMTSDLYIVIRTDDLNLANLLRRMVFDLADQELIDKHLPEVAADYFKNKTQDSQEEERVRTGLAVERVLKEIAGEGTYHAGFVRLARGLLEEVENGHLEIRGKSFEDEEFKNDPDAFFQLEYNPTPCCGRGAFIDVSPGFLRVYENRPFSMHAELLKTFSIAAFRIGRMTRIHGLNGSIESLGEAEALVLHQLIEAPEGVLLTQEQIHEVEEYAKTCPIYKDRDK